MLHRTTRTTRPHPVHGVRRRPVRSLALLAAGGLIVAACGGGGGDEESAVTTTEASAPTSTEAAVTSTTSAPTTAAADTNTPTTVAEAGPTFALTGLPLTDEAIAARPALVAKIDNHPQARPQFGLNRADIVFEENVENLTRFAAVYHSQDPGRIGPIRSGRTQDVSLLGSLSEPLFVWSGGNPNVTRAINDSDLVSLSPVTTRNVGFFRDRRPGVDDTEHTLFGTATEFWMNFTPIFNPPPTPQFQYRAPDEAFNGEEASGVELEMDGVDVRWTWDRDNAAYLRDQDGEPHFDDLGQVNAQNVVVLEVEYRPSPADARSPEAQTTGTGTAYVFTGGVLVRGTWTREDRLLPFTLTDQNGSVIALTPGRTWVELPRIGNTTPLP